VEEWLADKTVDQAVDMVLREGIPAGPIMDLKQISEDEHIANVREMFVSIDHPVAGKIKLNGNPVKFSETKAEIRIPFPTLGQHNEEILSSLGYTTPEIAQFRLDGII